MKGEGKKSSFSRKSVEKNDKVGMKSPCDSVFGFSEPSRGHMAIARVKFRSRIFFLGVTECSKRGTKGPPQI